MHAFMIIDYCLQLLMMMMKIMELLCEELLTKNDLYLVDDDETP